MRDLARPWRTRAPTGAPELGLYDGEPVPYDGQPAPYDGQPADAVQPTRPDDQPATHGGPPSAYYEQPRAYDGFTADEAQFSAHEDQLTAYEDRLPAYNGRPAAFSSPVVRPALRPVAPRARGRGGRAVLRWLGIAGCVLVVCLLIAGWLAWPETARLLSLWLAA